MSRKTMRTYAGPSDPPLNGPLYNLWVPPRDAWAADDHRRAQALIDGALSDQRGGPVYQRWWQAGHHLAFAGEDFTDALWSVSEGKRDVRQLEDE